MLCGFLATGAYLSAKNGFFQIVGFKKWINLTIMDAFRKKGNRTHSNGISPLAALSSALAASLGTGNIVGIATALCAGGPGTVFWMWISAMSPSPTTCLR